MLSSFPTPLVVENIKGCFWYDELYGTRCFLVPKALSLRGSTEKVETRSQECRAGGVQQEQKKQKRIQPKPQSTRREQTIQHGKLCASLTFFFLLS